MPALEGKVALVTGSSRGIGRGIAERLGACGASVVVNYVHNDAAAGEVVAGLHRAGAKAIAIQADMGRVSEVRSLFVRALEHFGRLDILVNSAGVAVRKVISEVSEEDFDRAFAVNVRGPFFALQEAARRMADGGRIINISSIGTVWNMSVASSRLALYLASKGALEQLTRALVKELGKRGITVNTVSPGYVPTDMVGNYTAEQKAMVIGMTALGRAGLPEDVASLVAFLASEDGGWVTGQNIRASGGLE